MWAPSITRSPRQLHIRSSSLMGTGKVEPIPLLIQRCYATSNVSCLTDRSTSCTDTGPGTYWWTLRTRKTQVRAKVSLSFSLLMSKGKEHAGSPVKGKWTGILALSSTWLWEARVSYSASLNFTGLLGMLLISELLYVNYSAHIWSVISIKNDSD